MGLLASYRPWPIYPRVRDPITIVQEAGSASGSVWTNEENLDLTVFRTPYHMPLSNSL